MPRRPSATPTDAPAVRDRFLATTARLLERQGYSATGLNQIVEESQAPKGSLYYYFPAGKEQLAAEAVVRQGQAVAAHIQARLAVVDDPAEAIAAFARDLAGDIAAGSFCNGGPITSSALESTSGVEQLRVACAQVYQQWQDVFTAKLGTSGFSAERSASLAAVCVAAIEGGIVLSRTAHDTTALERVGDELAALLRAARTLA